MSKSPRTLWIRPLKLLWLPALGAASAALWVFGTPHVLWSYRYTGSLDNKYYLDCDYLGRDSRRVVPTNGECSFILFLKPEGRRHG